MSKIGVDCIFRPDGSIQVRRIQVDGSWQSVGQGRQWHDVEGRHLLVMLPDQQTRELCLRSDTLKWELRPLSSQTNVV